MARAVGSTPISPLLRLTTPTFRRLVAAPATRSPLPNAALSLAAFLPAGKERTGRGGPMGNSATTASSCPALLGKTHDPGFVWKIHGFSALVKRGFMTTRSAPFDCSGYKWYLLVSLYPKTSCSIAPYVAASLGLSTGSLNLEPDYTIEVVFELSMYNHSDGMYRGCTGSYYFNGLDTQLDVEYLIPLYTLLKSSDFLVDDCCVIGVKILKVDAFSSRNN